MLLVCSARCGSRLFRALFAEGDIDSGGNYEDYRLPQPVFVCLNCGAPAVALSEAAADIAAEAEADAAPTVTDILCPVCETLVQVSGDMECPNCGAPLEA